MWLTTIREEIAKTAGLISRVLDVDVFVVDSNLRTVFNTYRYFDRYQTTRPSSVVGQVVLTGQVVVVEDKQNFQSCKACPDFQNCEMIGFVGVPIVYGDSVVGAIALILPRVKVGEIFRDIRNSVAFLENMSDLLSGKLRLQEGYTALSRMKREREVLMDKVREGVVSTDASGCISYHNRRFLEYFGLGESAVGRMITEVIPEKAVEDFILQEGPVPIRDRFIWNEQGPHPFYGLLSCTAIDTARPGAGLLFTFRSLSEVGHDFTVAADPAARLRLGQWEGQLSQWALDKARRLAKSEKPILIESNPRAVDVLFARCIHNHSSRRAKTFLALNAAEIAGLEESLLFGRPGRLYMAHGGTLFLQRVEQLSKEAGERLAGFIRPGRSAGPNVRFIFSTAADLGKMVEDGLFSEALFHHLSEDTARLKSPSGSHRLPQEQPIRKLERDRITTMLQAGHSKCEVACALGISRATLYRKIKCYQEKECSK